MAFWTLDIGRMGDGGINPLSESRNERLVLPTSSPVAEEDIGKEPDRQTDRQGQEQQVSKVKCVT